MENKSVKSMQAPFWVPGDWNAFFGLGTNSLLNILVLSGLLLGVIQMPAEIVFGKIVPAVGFMLFLSNIYYALMARRLALKEGRNDVTAMPAGPSVPHMFIVVFVIISFRLRSPPAIRFSSGWAGFSLYRRTGQFEGAPLLHSSAS